MIRDFSNSAKKKLLEYVKDATENNINGEKSVTELGMARAANPILVWCIEYLKVH